MEIQIVFFLLGVRICVSHPQQTISEFILRGIHFLGIDERAYIKMFQNPFASESKFPWLKQSNEF